MIKCDFCVASWYDNNGKVHPYESQCNTRNCADAIRVMSEVLKEEYKSRNSTNVNKNYNYSNNKNKK